MVLICSLHATSSLPRISKKLVRVLNNHNTRKRLPYSTKDQQGHNPESVAATPLPYNKCNYFFPIKKKRA